MECEVFCSSNYQNTEEEKRMFSACRDGDLETVRLLSRRVNAEDDFSKRPLHHAAKFVDEQLYTQHVSLYS